MVRSRNYIATPPGATIKEQLVDRGMSQKEFADRMGMSQKHISHLINGEVQLTPDMALRLEMVLGVPTQFWNNLEAVYREKLAGSRMSRPRLRKYFVCVSFSRLLISTYWRKNHSYQV